MCKVGIEWIGMRFCDYINVSSSCIAGIVHGASHKANLLMNEIPCMFGLLISNIEVILDKHPNKTGNYKKMVR